MQIFISKMLFGKKMSQFQLILMTMVMAFICATRFVSTLQKNKAKNDKQF